MLDEIIEMLEKCMYAQAKNGMDKVDTDEFGKVADIYYDLCKARYNTVLVGAMREHHSEYGEVWDEHGMINKPAL